MRRIFAIMSCTVAIAATLALPISAADEAQDLINEEVDVAVTVATEDLASDNADDATADTAAADKNSADKDIGDGESKNKSETVSEEELREIILRVADAVGAYEDDIPTAGKVKQWIIDNLASIVGFLMAASILIATPAGRKTFKNFVALCKNSLSAVSDWKDEFESVIAKNGEKNAELRASVNELMTKMTRDNEAANNRAEIAEQRAAELSEKLLQAEQAHAESIAKSKDVSEAVCRAVLVMAKPLEMSMQRSKSLDEMQKHEIFEEYRNALGQINDLLSAEHPQEEEANEDVD